MKEIPHKNHADLFDQKETISDSPFMDTQTLLPAADNASDLAKTEEIRKQELICQILQEVESLTDDELENYLTVISCLKPEAHHGKASTLPQIDRPLLREEKGASG